MCHHSFPLSLSGIASGDIHQREDTHTESVMCQNDGESCDGQKRMTHPDAGVFFKRKTLHNALQDHSMQESFQIKG